MSGRVPPSKLAQVRKAANIYGDFTGHNPEVVDVVPMPKTPDAVAVIGQCDGILYTTVRDGVTEKYIHKFKKSARPLFCVSPDGKQLLLIGGNFDFTERGIVDN